jgi:hypothetical protein
MSYFANEVYNLKQSVYLLSCWDCAYMIIDLNRSHTYLMFAITNILQVK